MLYSFFDKGLTKYIDIKKRTAIKIGDIIIKVTKVDINIAYLSFYCAYYKSAIISVTFMTKNKIN